MTIVPRANKNSLVGTLDDSLKIRIAAPPIDGAANKNLIVFLAKEMGVAKSRLEIVSGASSRKKTLLIKDADQKEAEDLLAKII